MRDCCRVSGVARTQQQAIKPTITRLIEVSGCTVVRCNLIYSGRRDAMIKAKQPQQLGDIINEQIQHSNAPLWAGLRAYRAQKGGNDEK